MAKIEDESPNPDETISPVELADVAEQPAGDEAKPVEAHAEPAAEAKPAAEAGTEDFGEEKRPRNLSRYVVIAIVIGVPVVFLAIAFVGLLNFSTAIYIICLAFIPVGLWLGRKTNTVYTVFLGLRHRGLADVHLLLVDRVGEVPFRCESPGSQAAR